MDSTAKFEVLAEVLKQNAPMVIAYSGGVDSAFLLAAAQRAIPDGYLAVIADSPSLPRAALRDALALAEGISAKIEVLETQEFENAEYLANPLNRCYFCKAELFQRMEQLAAARGFASLAYGENADDARYDRPGRTAAGQFRVLAPLNLAGLSKEEIRAESRKLGLPTADAPAQPCLSSRIPHGTPVTRESLLLVEKGEELVRSMGFRIFRVRFQAPAGAKVQIAVEEMAGLAGREEELISGLRQAGFQEVEIDSRGYAPPVPVS